MKFDSYARFVKSPLYQACARAESQGQPLPELRPHSRSGSPPSDHGKVESLKVEFTWCLGNLRDTHFTCPANHVQHDGV